MNQQRLLETFFDLVRIDSESRNEKQVAMYCKEALEREGCTVDIDDSTVETGANVGNLEAELKGELPGKIYFAAHMDTVAPGVGIEPYIDSEDMIRPRGETILGGDDKSGVAVIIELVRTLAESNKPHPTIGILLTVCEELNLLGARAMKSRTFNGEPCYVLDANGSVGKVITGAPFHSIFKAHFSGVAAHAGVEPDKGTSAIELAAKAIIAMDLGALSERATANVGTIHGGNADNIVPDSCVITGEYRSFRKDVLEKVKSQLKEAIEGAVTGSGCSVDITWHDEFVGYEISEDDPAVVAVLNAAKKLRLAPATEYSGGCSDANVFTAMGLNAVVLSTGMTNVHGLTEHLAKKDLLDLSELCIEITYSLAP